MSEAEIRRRVYGAIASWLGRGCCINSDDPEFIDAVWPVQEKIRIELVLKASPPGTARGTEG